MFESLHDTCNERLARLTAERDSLKTDVTIVFEASMGLLKEIDSLKADLAAARSSLGSIALTLRGLAALHQGDEHPILEEELIRIAQCIDKDEARLGTGEALAAVRAVQATVDSSTAYRAAIDEIEHQLRAALQAWRESEGRDAP